MFHIRVIKCQGTEGNNGPQQPYPASLGLPHPVPWPRALFQPSPEPSVCPRGAGGVWLSGHTTAGPTQSPLSPFLQRHLGMPRLPSWPALLPAQGPWNEAWLLRPIGIIGIPSWLLETLLQLQAAASARGTAQCMSVITNLGRVCIPPFSTGGKFSQQRFQTTHLQQCA